jgi:hypothetical protein
MAAPRKPKVRFVKQHTNWVGNVFRDYQAEDGRRVTIRVRTGRQGRWEYTNAEAKAEATRRLSLGVGTWPPGGGAAR